MSNYPFDVQWPAGDGHVADHFLGEPFVSQPDRKFSFPYGEMEEFPSAFPCLEPDSLEDYSHEIAMEKPELSAIKESLKGSKAIPAKGLARQSRETQASQSSLRPSLFERKSIQGPRLESRQNLPPICPVVGKIAEERVAAKIEKTKLFWEKKSKLIPCVFRMSTPIEQDPFSVLELQDLSHKALLVQGYAGRPKDTERGKSGKSSQNEESVFESEEEEAN